MTAGEWNLAIEAGAIYDETRTIEDENGDPWDFSDYDPATTGGVTGPRAQLRTGIDEPDPPLLSLAYTATPGTEGIAVLDPPTSGQVRIFIDADTTAALSYTTPGTPLTANRSGFWDLELVGASEADVIRPAKGAFSIDAEVTR